MRIGSGAILVPLLLCGLDTELITLTLGTQNGRKQIAARSSGSTAQDLKSYYKYGTLVTGKGAQRLAFRRAGRLQQAAPGPLSEAIQRSGTELLVVIREEGVEETSRTKGVYTCSHFH